MAGKQFVDINLKRHQNCQHQTRHHDQHPQTVDPWRARIFILVTLGIGWPHRAAQKVTTMNAVDDPSTDGANDKSHDDNRQTSEWLLRDQQKCGVAHGRCQNRDNAAETQPPGDILRHNDDGTTTARQCAECRGHRNLPDGVTSQCGCRIDFEEFFNAVKNEKCAGDKGAYLNISVGNSGKNDIAEFRICRGHSETGKDRRQQNGQPMHGMARFSRHWCAANGCCVMLFHDTNLALSNFSHKV